MLSWLFLALAKDINFNAMIGWLGPGTYPCWGPKCALCKHVGRSPVVNLGPHGVLNLTKRATCSTKNSVYVCVCTQCEQEGSFTTYFGESTQQLNTRASEHKTTPCNPSGPMKTMPVEQRRREVRTAIDSGVDNVILRDWFSNITTGGIHPDQHRISVVDIIPNNYCRRTKERTLVEAHMFHQGDLHYLGFGRGCLNYDGAMLFSMNDFPIFLLYPIIIYTIIPIWKCIFVCNLFLLTSAWRVINSARKAYKSVWYSEHRSSNSFQFKGKCAKYEKR